MKEAARFLSPLLDSPVLSSSSLPGAAESCARVHDIQLFNNLKSFHILKAAFVLMSYAHIFDISACANESIQGDFSQFAVVLARMCS